MICSVYFLSGSRRKRGAQQHEGKGKSFNEEDARGMQSVLIYVQQLAKRQIMMDAQLPLTF